jgi:hypothetical protein
MKKTLIVAGLISAAGLLTAAPAGAETPDSSVSCSPMPLCTIKGDVGVFVGSVGDFVLNGPGQFRDSVTGFVTEGPQEFRDSVKSFVQDGPKTFRDSITNPGGTE